MDIGLSGRTHEKAGYITTQGSKQRKGTFVILYKDYNFIIRSTIQCFFYFLQLSGQTEDM